MKAYGNHFQVSDYNTEGMVSFDYGVASLFGQRKTYMGDGDAMVEYVGVIKDIQIRLWTHLNSHHSHGVCMG
jgi:hypothetical protein